MAWRQLLSAPSPFTSFLLFSFFSLFFNYPNAKKLIRLFHIMIGEILAICSVFTLVISNAIFRYVDKKVSPSQINAIRTIIGSLTFLLIALILWQIPKVAAITPLTWLWLLLSVLFGQIVGDTAYFKCQEMLGTTVALAVTMTYPIFTSFFSIIILESIIPWNFYVSIALTTVGILILAFSHQKTQTKIIVGEQPTEKSNKESLMDVTTKKTIEEQNYHKLKTPEQKNDEQIPDQTENRLLKESLNEEIEDQEYPDILSREKESTKLKSVFSRLKNKSFLFLAGAFTLGIVASLSWAIGIVLTEKAFKEVSVLINSENYANLIGNIIRFPCAAGVLAIMTTFDRG
ncbi:EamA family transporter, partial [Candidatus Heimdallarchaeota archaeon]